LVRVQVGDSLSALQCLLCLLKTWSTRINW
jgi:hypothetical protein